MESKYKEKLNIQLQNLIELINSIPDEKKEFNLIELENGNRYIHEMRELLGLTLHEVSQLSGVAMRSVQKIDKGELNITLSSLLKVLDVLGIQLCLKKK